MFYKRVTTKLLSHIVQKSQCALKFPPKNLCEITQEKNLKNYFLENKFGMLSTDSQIFCRPVPLESLRIFLCTFLLFTALRVHLKYQGSQLQG